MDAMVGPSLSLVGFTAGAAVLFILYWIKSHCPLCFKSWSQTNERTIPASPEGKQLQEWQCSCCGHVDWIEAGRRFALPTSF